MCVCIYVYTTILICNGEAIGKYMKCYEIRKSQYLLQYGKLQGRVGHILLLFFASTRIPTDFYSLGMG